MKVLIIGDVHHGERSDCPKYNSHLLEFYDHVIEYANRHSIKTAVQLGDFFHHRNKIQVSTLTHGIAGAKKLSEAFTDVYVLAGNHDLFYKDRLDTSSLAALDAYVTVIDEPTTVGNMLLCPWIIDGEMWDAVCNASETHDYLLAHLELSGFKLNEAYVMEHGFSHKELKGYDKVITGHYHSKQQKDNIYYTGTPLPITMNEANEDHGFFVLDTDTGDLEFIKYDKVKVVSISYEDIETIEDFDPEYTTVRVEFPDTLDDETLITDVQDFLKEKGFEGAKIKYKSQKVRQILEASDDEVEEVEDIDAVVKAFLGGSFSVDGIEKERLVKYYDAAIKKGADL